MIDIRHVIDENIELLKDLELKCSNIDMRRSLTKHVADCIIKMRDECEKIPMPTDKIVNAPCTKLTHVIGCLTLQCQFYAVHFACTRINEPVASASARRTLRTRRLPP